MAAPRFPQFDPLAPRARHQGWLEAVARTALGRRFGIDVASRLDPWLLRISGGRLRTFVGSPTAALTTTGARSGQPRTAAVLYFTDGDAVILIASNFGQDHHPGWYHNLCANPRAVLERNGVRVSFDASEVRSETERERLFQLAQHLYRGYADYRRRTAALGRRIPIMRLEPCAPASRDADR